MGVDLLHFYLGFEFCFMNFNFFIYLLLHLFISTSGSSGSNFAISTSGSNFASRIIISSSTVTSGSSDCPLGKFNLVFLIFEAPAF